MYTGRYGTESNYDQYAEDYVALYVDTLKQRVEAEDPSRSFLVSKKELQTYCTVKLLLTNNISCVNVKVSSPTNGVESEEEGYLADDPYDSQYGDTHFYNYNDDNWDYTMYPLTRFASEYGFQVRQKKNANYNRISSIYEYNCTIAQFQ